MSGGLWGFHRLTPEWAERVVAAAAVRPGQLVVDVGAGTGILTDALLSAGARVIAVELHPRRAERLRDRLSDDSRVSVLTMDIADFRWPGRPVSVVANPPFAILPELIAALRRHRTLVAADLVVPRAAVHRHTTRHLDPRTARRSPHRGLQPSAGLNLPRSAFTPRPPLDCGVLRLRR